MLNWRSKAWRREQRRQDSGESTSTQASGSIREFELFREFCTTTDYSWVVFFMCISVCVSLSLLFFKYQCCFHLLLCVTVQTHLVVHLATFGFSSMMVPSNTHLVWWIDWRMLSFSSLFPWQLMAEVIVCNCLAWLVMMLFNKSVCVQPGVTIVWWSVGHEWSPTPRGLTCCFILSLKLCIQRTVWNIWKCVHC